METSGSKPEVLTAQKSVEYLTHMDEEQEPPERQTWGGKLEFILTCVGFAVGLGNVWRFPYLAYENGGGAFLIPYVLMLFLIGFPMFFMEVSLGQFASLSPITLYNVAPAFKGVGIASVIVTAIITWYYNVVIAWILFYFFASMNSELPWGSCGNWWNTECCLESDQNRTANVTYLTPSEEYYYNNVLRLPQEIGELGGLRWQLVLCLLLSWIIIFLVLLKGIESLGKAAYFVSLFPYVLLTIMLVRGATLPGAADGIEYYIKPVWSKLLEADVWSAAATQIFYSLGISMGSLIAMASFNDFNNNILRDAMIIPFVNCGTSIYAGFVIFSVLGYMANLKGVPISEVAAEGPGLIFVVYPEGLSTMPAAPVWSVLFFFMMTTLGFSSQFSTAEGVIAAFCDEFPETLRRGRRPFFLRMALCIMFFLLALPMVTEGGFHLFTVINEYSGSYTLLVIAFFEILVFQYIYGYDRFSEDLALMLGKKPAFYFFVQWKIITPVLVVFVFLITCINYSPLTFEGQEFPNWLEAVGWVAVAIPLSAIVIVFIKIYCGRGGSKVLQEVTSPASSWGPARGRDRRGRYMIPDVIHVSCEEFTSRNKQQNQQLQELNAFTLMTGATDNKQDPPEEPLYAQIMKTHVPAPPSSTTSSSGVHEGNQENETDMSSESKSSLHARDISSSPISKTPEDTSQLPMSTSGPTTTLTTSSVHTKDVSSVDGDSTREIQEVRLDFSETKGDKEQSQHTQHGTVDSEDIKVTEL